MDEKSGGSDWPGGTKSERSLIHLTRRGLVGPAPFVFSLCGVLPWRDAERSKRHRPSTAYQWLVLGLAMLALVQMVTTRAVCQAQGELRECLRGGLLSDVAFAVGAIVGLLLLGTVAGSPLLIECFHVILGYERRCGGVDWMLCESYRETALTLLTWFSAIALRVCIAQPFVDDVIDLFEMVAFVVSSGVLVGLALCMTYVARYLVCMVDNFCSEVVQDQDLAQARHEWNVLQAILRKVSGCVERCICAVVAAASFAPLLMVADSGLVVRGEVGGTVVTLMPGALVTLVVVRMVFCVAAVSDRCTGVAPLINMMCFSAASEAQHQLLVANVVNSSAGFYMLNVRLTTFMVVKFLYVWVALAGFLAANIIWA